MEGEAAPRPARSPAAAETRVSEWGPCGRRGVGCPPQGPKLAGDAFPHPLSTPALGAVGRSTLLSHPLTPGQHFSPLCTFPLEPTFCPCSCFPRFRSDPGVSHSLSLPVSTVTTSWVGCVSSLRS